MDFLILGLLLLKPRTLYEIRITLETKMNMLYSSSTGSIQAAIRKLIKDGFIKTREVTEGNVTKKVYEATKAGKKAFDSWVNQDFESEKIRNPELLKLYFMGLSDPDQREGRIKNHIEKLTTVQANLTAVFEEGKQLQVPEELSELFKYQMLTAKFGKDLLAFQIDWFNRMLLTKGDMDF